MDIGKQQRQHEAGVGNSMCLGGRADSTTGGTDLLLLQLEGVKRAGKGWIARCPAHTDRTASLSVTEAEGGKLLLHCFAGCHAAAIMHAVGLSLADLFPTRLTPTTPGERRAALRAALHADWDAALGVLCREASIVLIVSRELSAGQQLSGDDAARLVVASHRIDSARLVLHGR